MFQVTASCPTRVDLVGGTLDLWPIYHQLPRKATVNLAIDLRAEVEVTESSSFKLESEDQKISLEGTFCELSDSKELSLLSLFLKALWSEDLPPITIKTRAKSPKGAGIGGSSSLSIAVCSALYKARKAIGLGDVPEEKSLVDFSRDLESVIIQSPTGYQDYLAAVRGGLNLITYPYGFPETKTLCLGGFEAISERLVVVYSGQSRASALNNWSVYKNFFSGEKRTVKTLEEIGELAFSCAEHLEKNEVEEALKLSFDEWKLRKKLWPDIVTERTEFINKLAMDSGASFSRVCGAGGGGVMALFVEPSLRSNLLDKLKKGGVELLGAKPTELGLV